MGRTVCGGIVVVVFSIMSAVMVHADDGPPHLDRDEAFRYVRAVMSQFSTLQQDVGDALRNRRPEAVTRGVEEIVSLLPLVKYGPIHRNLDRLKVMGRVANPFRANLEESARQAAFGNYSAAGEAFRAARSGCTECHALVREVP